MRWESIRFETDTITIEHTVTTAIVDVHRIEVVEDTAKSKSGLRSLPLIPAFRNKLWEVREEQERNKKLFGRSYNRKDSDYVLTDKLGNRIKPDSVTRRFPNFLNDKGLRQIRFHVLRHTSASLLIANNVLLIKVKEWLGHSEIGITADTYGHLEFASKKESAEAMSWIHDTMLAQTYQDKAPEHDVPTSTGYKNNQPILYR